MNVPRTMALYRPERRSLTTFTMPSRESRTPKATGLSCYYSYNGDVNDFNGYAGVGAGLAFKYFYAYLDIDRRKLMLIVAKERGKWLLLLWALGFSTVGRFCIYLFPAVWGVIGTLFLAQAFASMGIAGIGLGLLFQVPQILIYVPLFLWMMEEADKKSRQFAYLRKIGTAGKNNRRYFLCFFVALSVLFLGILTESYAGSGLVQMILRIVY